MAVVTISASAPAGLRIQDLFSASHGPFTWTTTNMGYDRGRVTNTGGYTVDYYGIQNSPSSYTLQFIMIGVFGAPDFRWTAAAGQTLNLPSVQAFHESASSAAAIMANDDQVTGSTKADYLEGYDGNDTLDGAGGADTMAGGFGNDTYFVDNPGDTVLEAAGGGFDIVATSASFYVLLAGQEIELLRAANAISTAPINLAGNERDDTIIGSAGANILNGNDGNDYLFSHGFNASGELLGGAGHDILNGGAGDDGLFAGDGNDVLDGGAGNDGLVGGAGVDTLNGGIGNDFLFGGGFSAAGARLPNSGADTLNGGDGNDGLYGFDGADIINGDGGNDYVEGGAGNDTINGGAGSDYLLGEGDNDTINGGTGFDYMYGGLGADTFIFRKSDSADWILDFNAAQGDKLRLLDFGYASFTAVPLVDLSTPGHPAVQFTFSGPSGVDQLTIFGVTLAQLNAGNVLVA